jgi:hypothetical protein
MVETAPETTWSTILILSVRAYPAIQSRNEPYMHTGNYQGAIRRGDMKLYYQAPVEVLFSAALHLKFECIVVFNDVIDFFCIQYCV